MTLLSELWGERGPAVWFWQSGLWRSLVAHYTGGVGAAGSNPVSPTMRQAHLGSATRYPSVVPSEPTWTDSDLADAVAAARSWRQVLRSLGLAATSSSSIRTLRKHVERLGLDTSHFTGQRTWSEAQLVEAVTGSTSWAQVMDRLGLSGGSSTSALKGHAARLGLDVSHFGTRVRFDAGSVPSMDVDLTRLPRAGSMIAASWFTLTGFDVSWPLEPCRYDLVVARDGAVLKVQVKTTRSRHGEGWTVMLSTTSGGRRTYDPDDVDLFFVVDGDLCCYAIPVAAVGGMHSVNLTTASPFRVGADRWISSEVP